MPPPLRIQLPTGGALIGSTDPSLGLPSDCSRVLSFLPQVASYLASVQCLLKVLQLTGPLVDVIKALPASPQLAAPVQQFIKAAEGLAPCLQAGGPSVITFIKDLLCLTVRALNCIMGEMKVLLGVMSDLERQLDSARVQGNTELVNLLQGEQKKAQFKAENLIASIEPIRAILDLARIMFGIAGLEPMQIPTFGSQSDLNSLNQLVESLQSIVGVFQIVADSLGGCEG